MHELLTQFGIDWKLLIAQVVNFGILIFLLSKFAYKPVIKMLDLRREKIKEGLEASELSKKKLAETTESQKQILLAAEQNALAVVSEAETLAAKQGEEIIDAAHKKGEQVILSGQKILEAQKQTMADEVVAGAEHMIQVSLAKVLAKKEPQERDNALIAAALAELRNVARTS